MGHVTRGHITNANWQKQQHWGGAFWHVSELKNSIHGGSNKWLKIFFNFVTMGHVTLVHITNANWQIQQQFCHVSKFKTLFMMVQSSN